jgi:hypothetical protein
MLNATATLLAATLAASTAADAAPRRDQLHVQAQTGLLAREALRVDEVDAARSAVQVGPGAGGVALAMGYMLRSHSEVGSRIELSRMTINSGETDLQRGHARLAGSYTYHFRTRAPVHLAATGMFGLERTSYDGDALARGPFVGVAGNAHWFVTPRLSVNTGVEATRSLGGRYEEGGMDGSSRFAASEVAAVAGLNFYLGARQTKGGQTKSGRRR